MIAGHDYKPGRFPGVVRAVDEAFGGAATADPASTVWAVTVGEAVCFVGVSATTEALTE